VFELIIFIIIRFSAASGISNIFPRILLCSLQHITREIGTWGFTIPHKFCVGRYNRKDAHTLFNCY